MLNMDLLAEKGWIYLFSLIKYLKLKVWMAECSYLCKNKAQLGLACENSWGAIAYPQYRLPYGNYEFSFIMKPVFNKVY